MNYLRIVLLSTCLLPYAATAQRFNRKNIPFAQTWETVYNRNGRCYGVYPKGYEADTSWAAYPFYTGSDRRAPMTELTIELQPAFSKWVKKKSNAKCLSANPDDCMVWCLEEHPGQSTTIHYLADTVRYKEFDLINVPTFIKVVNAGQPTEMDVLCKEQRTPALARKCAEALKKEGYLDAPQEGFNAVLYNALERFQKDNHLVSGLLTQETLDLLDVRE